MLLGNHAKLISGCHAKRHSDVDALIVAGISWSIDLNMLPLSHVLAWCDVVLLGGWTPSKLTREQPLPQS
jgi:hypothetical protein